MKHRLLTSLLALASVAPTCYATANSNAFTKPYVGIEIIQTMQKFKNGYGKNQFPSYVQDYNAFIGFKLDKYLGLEAGYDMQPRTEDESIVFPGQTLPGQPELGAGTLEGAKFSYKSTDPYVGIFAECASNMKFGHGKVVFQALVGASLSKVKARITREIIDGLVIEPNPVLNFSQRKAIPMVKLSAATNMTKNLAVRVSLNYRHMSSFKIVSDIPAGQSNLIIKMQDSYGLGVGLKYSF